MILTNCRVIPELCEGFQEEMVDIRIEGKTIAEILPAGGHYVGEEVVDCTGKTVLPGLFNVHVHLGFNFDYMMHDFSEQTSFLTSMRYMNTLLSYGYTSLRECGASYGIPIRLRDEINRGALIGPDIKACGNILTPYLTCTPEHLKHLGTASDGRPIDGPYRMRAEARNEISKGADFLKIFGGCPYGAFMKRGPESVFFPDELDEVKKVAALEHTYVASHCISTENVAEAIELEFRTIEHALYMTPDNVDQLLAHGNKSLLVPTFTVQYLLLSEEDMMAAYGNMRLAHDAGALIGWGTDAMENMFFANPAAEFLGREKCMHLSPVEILKQATINSAIINETEKERGSIKVGKYADFAIVDGKPDEDLTVFGRPCALVFKDGELVAQNGMVKYTNPKPAE